MRDKISVILMMSLAAFAPGKSNAAEADPAADIIARYNASRSAAEGVCAGLSGKIDQVKTMAGIGIATGAVGAIGGGVGMGAGIMKMRADKSAAAARTPSESESLATDQRDGENVATADEITAGSATTSDNGSEAESETPANPADKSKTYGTVRTVGSFVAGGSNAVGAVVQLSGAGTLDEVVADMESCSVHVKDIEKLALELRMTAPDDPKVAEMNAIAQNCSGLNPKNIADVKSKLKFAGVFSAVGGVAGIAGGVTSMIAAKKDNQPGGPTAEASANGVQPEEKKTNGLNMASTVLSGTSAAIGLTSAIISGVTLSGLNKNSDIAKRCGEAFHMETF